MQVKNLPKENQNKLSTDHIDKVVETYQKREDVEKYAHVASFEEIKENDFNLNIPRYVDTFEEEEPVDMTAIGAKIQEIRKEKEELESNLYDMISSMQFDEKDAEWMKGALEVFKRGSKSVPEVRFKGFSGEWDECKIVDVLNINSGRDYKHLKKEISQFMVLVGICIVLMISYQMMMLLELEGKVL